MRNLGILLAVAVVAVFAATANADLLAFWHFDDSTNLGTSGDLWRLNPVGLTTAKTKYASDLGTSTTAKLSTWGSGGLTEGILVGTNGGTPGNNFGTFSGNVLNDPRPTPNAGSALSMSGSQNNSKYFLMGFNEGWDNVVLTYANRATSTGYGTNAWDYSTDGGVTWTNLTTLTLTKDGSWYTKTVNFGSVFVGSTGIEKNLIRCVVAGVTNTNGNNRFDNIQINGLLPEPATLVLLAIGGLALIRRK